MTQHALVVDDHDPFLRFVTFSLAKGGYRVTPLSCARETLLFLERELPDIILLDRLLPDINGFAVCKKLKATYPNIPVVMFSTAGEAGDVIAGLEIGADDYLPKPFSPEMLLAKVKAVGRRYQMVAPGEEMLIKVGKLVINEGTHEVTLDDHALELTKSEFKILVSLSKRPGVVMDRGKLMEESLGYSAGVANVRNNLAFHVTALRRKLGEYRHYIETVRGFGYRVKAVENH